MDEIHQNTLVQGEFLPFRRATHRNFGSKGNFSPSTVGFFEYYRTYNFSGNDVPLFT